MSITQWAWLITAAVAALLGWLTAKFVDDKKAIAYMVALLVASVGGSVALYLELVGIRADQASVLGRVVPTIKSPIWSSVVQDIADYDRQNQGNALEETLNEPLRQAISRNINQAREGYIEIPDKNEVVVVTLRLLDKAQQSVRATSYIDPKEWWGSEIAQAYNEKLKATKQHVGVFQRIFIVGSTDEAKMLKPVMDAQEKAGLEVRYVCAASIPADQRDDFIIVDSSVAAQLILNEQRHFKNAQFFSTRVRADDFDHKFNNLWVGGRLPSDAGKVSCSLPSGK
jgi:hypothetical protein